VAKIDVNIDIGESRIEAFTEALTSLVHEYGGGSICVQKDLKFEDLGLVEIEKNKFQCLACSYTTKDGKNAKMHAKRHFENVHMKKNKAERKVQCPRCDEEVPKSGMNSHMNQKHGVKNFNELLKRSFQPESNTSENSSTKMPKNTLDNDEADPLAPDLKNNEIKTKQIKDGLKKNTKQEPNTSENSSKEMPKKTLDSDDVDPFTQELVGWMDGLKEHIKQE